jgi:hypothetical protein
MESDMKRLVVRAVCAALIAFATMPASAKKPGGGHPVQKIVKLKLGPFKIDAKRDREVCQAIKVPNVAGMEVDHWEARSRLSNKGLTGSHHLVLYGYDGTDSTKFPKELADDPGCSGFGPPDFFRRRVFLSGSGGETPRGNWSVTSASYPGDLAQVMPSSTDDRVNSWVVINSHYFNDSTKRASGLVRLKLWLRPLDTRKRVIRQVIHGDASEGIMLPPGTKSDPAANPISAALRADGAPNYSTEGGYNPSGDVCIFNLATHMHKRGTRFLIQYAESDQVETTLDWHDWLHPGILLLPSFGPIAAAPTDRAPGLLRAYTAENGFPEIRYACEMANGVDDRETKMGCEETPGVVPGVPWDGEDDGTTTHAKPCGENGVNCDGKPCVPANLVFGPLSDDDMCILTATVYDPLPGVPPDQACRFRALD